MKLKLYTIIVVTCCFFVSCEKESLVNKNDDDNLLKQVLIDGEVYYEYTYNSSGSVLEEKSKFHYSKHKYNRKNQLIQSDHFWDERIASSSSHVLDIAMNRTEWISPDNAERDSYKNYEYDKNGMLKKIITHRMTNDYTSYSTYTYNQQGRIERRTSNHENSASVVDKYFYDIRGNLIKEERFFIMENGTEKLQTTTKYEFDNKLNPYLSFRKLMTPGKYTNANNIIKETYTLHFEVDDFIEKVQVSEYQYDYNEKDYPVRRNDSFEYIYF